MKLQIRIMDFLVSTILSIPIGGFMYGFLSPGLALKDRLMWGVFGIFGFCSGVITATSAMLSNAQIIRYLFAGYISALLSIFLMRTLTKSEFNG